MPMAIAFFEQQKMNIIMKYNKLFIILLALFTLNTTSFAGEVLIKTVKIHKENGKRHFFGLTRPRYNIANISEMLIPAKDGERDFTFRNVEMEFKNPGSEKCDVECAEDYVYGYNSLKVSEKNFDLVINSLLKKIDRLLKKGQSSGSYTEEMTVEAGGIEMKFRFLAEWKNGNENGDADIFIRVWDISNFGNKDSK